MSPAAVSVVIVNFNSGPFLLANLESLSACALPLELIVVDCASPIDQSGFLARAEQLGARVMVAATNLGYAGGCNLGLRHASAEFVAFSNADVVHVGDVISPLVEFLDREPDVALTTPRAWFDPSLTFAIPDFHAVTRRALLDEALRSISGRWAFRRSRELARSRIAFWRKDGVTEHDNLHGAFLVARRSALESLGAFDESYPLYYEDTDLFVRARSAGMRLTCQHTVSIVHRIHRSSGTVWSEAMAKLIVGRERFIRSHLGPVSVVFDRLARALASRRRARPARRFAELGERASPPRFEWPDRAAEEYVVELSLDPHFVEAAGHFVSAPPFSPSPAAWSSLNPGIYFARVLALPALAELARWRFTIPLSLAVDGSGNDGMTSSD